MRLLLPCTNSQQQEELPRTATVVLRLVDGLVLTSATSLSLFHKPPSTAAFEPQAVQVAALVYVF